MDNARTDREDLSGSGHTGVMTVWAGRQGGLKAKP
jgi:hypothetical protein